MTSTRHKGPDSARPPEVGIDPLLQAAREAILAVGWSRTTLTDIARRAGVSRMTLYRRWPDMGSLLGDLMTQEWTSLVVISTGSGSHLGDLTRSVIASIDAIRSNDLFARIIELDPDLLLPYLLERSGRSQEYVVTLLADQIRAGQRAGDIRSGQTRVARPVGRTRRSWLHPFGAHDG